MATHFSILAWRSPWTAEPGGLKSLGSHCSYRLDMGVSGNLWIVVKDVKTLVVYDVE